MDEQEAISKLKQGDIAGLEVLVDLHYVRAARAAYLVLQERSSAEDVVQSAFLRVFERAEQFDPHRPFGPWFMRIIVNDAVKVARRQQRDLSLDAKADGDGEQSLFQILQSHAAGPEEVAEKTEVRQAIWDALGALSPENRSAVVLHYFLGFQQAEIAERTGAPVGTVKRRLHDARRRLRVLLAGVRS